MTTAYTSLLGLALPVTGELSGTWGDTVNTAITSLLDTAVAGTTSITTDADITLTTTTGASNQARQAILLWNPASGTTTRYITAPAQSKLYTVINASGGTQSIVIRGVGPTTGVTIAKGESAMVAWNGSDFVKVSSSGGAITFTDLTVTGNTILGDAAADTLTVNATSTFASPVNFQGLVKLPSTGRSAAAALTVTAPAFLYGVASTYTDTTSSGTIGAMAPFYSIAQPTLSTSNVTTYTNAATLYIANAPAAGGSATITNPYALYVAGGANYFAGNATFASNVTLGDAAADTVTVNGTITSNLLFTDNTYDIGAAGATRPRDFYLARKAYVYGNVFAGTAPAGGYTTQGVFIADNTSNTTGTGSFALGSGGSTAYAVLRLNSSLQFNLDVYGTPAGWVTPLQINTNGAYRFNGKGIFADSTYSYASATGFSIHTASSSASAGSGAIGFINGTSNGIYHSIRTDSSDQLCFDSYYGGWINNASIATNGAWTFGKGVSIGATYSGQDALSVNGALNGSGSGLVVYATTRTSSENNVRLVNFVTNSGVNAFGMTVDGRIGLGNIGTGFYHAVTLANGGYLGWNNSANTDSQGYITVTSNTFYVNLNASGGNPFYITGGSAVIQNPTNGSGVVTVGNNSGRSQYQYINFAGATGGTDYAWQMGRSPNTGGVVNDGFYLFDIKANKTALAVTQESNTKFYFNGPSAIAGAADTTLVTYGDWEVARDGVAGTQRHARFGALPNMSAYTGGFYAAVYSYDGSSYAFRNLIEGNPDLGGSNNNLFLPYGQLRYPATQNPSTNANTLDDYEEGTYTCTVSYGTGSTVSPTSSGTFAVTAYYIKIGKQVTVQWDFVNFSANGLTTGDFINYMSLPFTVESGGTYRGTMSGVWRGIDQKYGNTVVTYCRLGGLGIVGANTMGTNAEDQTQPFSGQWRMQSSSGCYLQGGTFTYTASA